MEYAIDCSCQSIYGVHDVGQLTKHGILLDRSIDLQISDFARSSVHGITLTEA